MECPTCGNTAFLPNSKFCQQCGSKLPRASVIPSTRESITKDTKVSSLNAKQADTGDKSDLEVDKGLFEGDNLERKDSVTVTEHDEFSLAKERSNKPATQKGHDASGMQVAAVYPIEVGVNNGRSVQTDPDSTAEKLTVQQFPHMEGSHGAAKVSTGEVVRSAAELDNSNSTLIMSFDAGEKDVSLGNSSETTGRSQIPTQEQQQQASSSEQFDHQQMKHSAPYQKPSQEEQIFGQQQHQPEKNQQAISQEDNRTDIGRESDSSTAGQTSERIITDGSSQASQKRQVEKPSTSADQKPQRASVTKQEKLGDKDSGGNPLGTKHAVENTDVTPNIGKVETTALVSSASPQDKESVVKSHPLEEEINRSEAKPVKTGGRWYQKNAKPAQETKADPKKKKGKKQPEQHKGDHQPDTTTRQVRKSVKEVDPELGVTIVFHILLDSTFNIPGEASLHIRANGVDIGHWNVNCVDLKLIENCRGKKKLLRFSGQFTFSVDRASTGITYKYVVVKEEKLYYEYLTEFEPRVRNGIVDRFLRIPYKYLKPGGKWDQWDGVAYIYGERGWFGRVYDYLRSKETVENRTLALKTYLPKWKGFLVNEPAEKMTATEAIVKLDRVVSCLFANIWVKDNHCSVPEKKKPPEFNVKAVLVEILQPKVMKNSSLLGNSRTDLNTRASAVVSSLAIVLLLKQYEIPLERDYKLLLLRCLALEADPSFKRCTAYEAVLEEFSDSLRKRAVEGIQDLCNEIMATSWRDDGEWLFAIPLLHFLRGDSRPFEEPNFEGSKNHPESIGAQNLRIREFQRTEKRHLLDALPLLVSAFEVDRLFKRTFVNAIPAWELHKFVASKMFHVYDICLALVTFCSREAVPTAKV